jgi:hypothetical protein
VVFVDLDTAHIVDLADADKVEDFAARLELDDDTVLEVLLDTVDWVAVDRTLEDIQADTADFVADILERRFED